MVSHEKQIVFQGHVSKMLVKYMRPNQKTLITSKMTIAYMKTNFEKQMSL